MARETEITRILDELQREHSGDPWHGTPLLDLLSGIDAAQAAARPVAGAHTIWEIVLHMTAWKHEVRRRAGGAAAGTPEEGDWPPAPGPTEDAWRQAVQALDRAHAALVAAIAALSEEALFAPTNDPRNRETGQGVTTYVLLHGIVQHDVYHAGQIALLKKSLA